MQRPLEYIAGELILLSKDKRSDYFEHMGAESLFLNGDGK